MRTGKTFGKITLRHGGRDHRCEWTFHDDRTLLVVLWITNTHVARQWTVPLPTDTNLNDTARNLGISMLGPEP